MEVKLIYSTPDYHKLVETVMRICYQSYDKETESSHKSIRAIMAKGHLSIASVGNMVFGINGVNDTLLVALMEMHEITPFIKWSRNRGENISNYDFVVSMNMLTLLDILKERENLSFSTNYISNVFLEVLEEVLCLKWFYDKTVELPDSPNMYSAKGCPTLYEPIVLDEDYTALKALGLNDYELGIHSTITMNFMTDRATSLQLWRHWAGGCELSQRYVDCDNSVYREVLGVDERTSDFLKDCNKNSDLNYKRIMNYCQQNDIRKGRAKEIARSILPNSITTQLIQSRPYRNWMHLFKLRDDKHAQLEVQEDVRAIKKSLHEIGVKIED